MQLFDIDKSDPTQDKGAFIGGAIACVLLLAVLVGLGSLAPPDKRSAMQVQRAGATTHTE